MVAAPVELRTQGPGNGNGRGLGNGNGRGLGRGLGNQNPGGGPDIAEGPPNAVAQLAVSLAPIDATLAQLRLVTAVVAGAVLLLAAACAWLITRRGLGPLDRLGLLEGRRRGGGRQRDESEEGDEDEGGA